MAKRIEKRMGYVEHGSDKHAAILGLRRPTKEDTLVYKEWTLENPNQFGPHVTEHFVKNHLIQLVTQLENTPSVPADAPRMWTPEDVEAEAAAA